MVQQAIRFMLTVGLLIVVYKGKKWAKNLAVVLFLLGALGALFSGYAWTSLGASLTYNIAAGLALLALLISWRFIHEPKATG